MLPVEVVYLALKVETAVRLCFYPRISSATVKIVERSRTTDATRGFWQHCSYCCLKINLNCVKHSTLLWSLQTTYVCTICLYFSVSRGCDRSSKLVMVVSEDREYYSTVHVFYSTSIELGFFYAVEFGMRVPSLLNSCVRVCVCFLPIHSGHQVRRTYQPGSHRRKVTQDFSSTFFLRCVP